MPLAWLYDESFVRFLALCVWGVAEECGLRVSIGHGGGQFSFSNSIAAPVPEPASIALLGAGLAVGGDTGWIVIRSAGGESRAEHMPVILSFLDEFGCLRIGSQYLCRRDRSLQQDGWSFGAFS